MNKITWTVIFFLYLFIFPARVFAQQVCQQQDPCSNKSLQDQPACYQSVVDACKNQRETLSSQINLMNNQIRLMTLKIENTKAIINKLSGEISELGNEITRLEGILTQRSTLLLRRIPESYKRASVSQFGILFFSHNLSDFITRAKYLSKVQNEDAEILFQVKATQNNFSERKSLREEKRVEQEKAKKQLEQQNRELTQQKQAKDALLVQTKGQEATYAQLRTQALAQLSGFASFTQGLGLLSNQTFCDGWGCYYSQRDSQWGNAIINGQSSGCGYTVNGKYVDQPCSVLNVGCLIASIAMFASHLGRKDILPSDIAFSSPYNFSAGTAMLMKGTITVKGVNINRTQIASSLDPSLVQNGPVIVGIKHGPYGSHFVVIKSYENGKYIMNDPVTENGHDISFTDHYSVGSVFEVDRVSM